MVTKAKQADGLLSGHRDFVGGVAKSFFRHDGTTYAMALEFRGLLALFPFALFLGRAVGVLARRPHPRLARDLEPARGSRG